MLEVIAETLDISGKIIVSFTAIAVHRRFRKEHRVDERVFSEMKKEQYFAILGIALMITAYLINIYIKVFTP